MSIITITVDNPYAALDEEDRRWRFGQTAYLSGKHTAQEQVRHHDAAESAAQVWEKMGQQYCERALLPHDDTTKELFISRFIAGFQGA